MIRFCATYSEMSTDQDWIGLQFFLRLADQDWIGLRKYFLFQCYYSYSE